MITNKSSNKFLGSKAEQIACDFLLKHGFEIIEKNVTFNFGEIDIVAKDKNILCFIEVKSKNSNDFGAPETQVTYTKQQKLIKLAGFYLKKHYPYNPPICRFDIIAILGYDDESKINHIKNAFVAEYNPKPKKSSPWQVY
jgi:putative endonuclease